MRIIYCLIFSILLASCASKKETTEKKEATPFFDLKELVENDIKSLEQNACKAKKTGSVNDKDSEAVVDIVNWKLELEAIAQADINKSSWVDFFKVDTLTWEEGQLIRYSTTNSDIPIKKLEVFIKDSSTVKVNIERLSKNLLFESKQNIVYFPRKSFEATGSQKAIFLKAQTFSIHTEFECM